MVNIRQQLVTGKARLVSKGTNPRRYVTVHDTGNTGRGANAAAHANLQSRGNSRSASWHWTVDDKEAVQSYEHTARCWHAGDGGGSGNMASIGVEICVNSDGDYTKALSNAAELVAHILKQEGLDIGAVVQHNRWSGKNCPAGIRAGRSGVTWARFLDMVRANLSGTPSTPAPVAPKPTTNPAAKPSTGAPYAELLVDGVKGPVTIRAWQHLMKAIGRYKGRIDGDFGPLTAKAMQAWLAGLGHYKGRIDGDWGPLSVKALQAFLTKKGLYTGLIDGKEGPLTVKAGQSYLNSQRKTWG